MAIYYLSDNSEVDDKVINYLSKYLIEDIKFGAIYRDFKNLSVSKIHPFVKLLSDVNRTKVKDVLPSITVALLEDDGANVAINRSEEMIEMTSSLLQEIEDQEYGLNRENIFDELYGILNSGNKLFAKQVNRRFNQNLTFEIWADNDIIKDVLYEAVKDFIDFYAESLYDIGMENINIRGKKDGDYNFDFGTVMYGANVTLSFVATNMIFYIDTGISEIAGIKHYEGNISGNYNS